MFDGVKATMKVDGLRARFAALVPAAREEVAAAALKGAEDVRDLAKHFVPVKSGKLRDTITAEAMPDRLGAQVAAGSEETEVRKGSGVNWNYARGVEFGTAKHRNKGKFAGSMHPGSKPHPFLFPAARLLKKRNKARIGRAMGKAARKVAK